MKSVIFVLFLSIFFLNLNAQTTEFNKVTSKGEFKEYISKNKDTIKTGDKLLIGLPSADLGFVFITQGGQITTPNLAYSEITIKKILSLGSKKKGYKIYLQFDGFGLIPILIDYEPAFYSKEIILKY